MKNNQMTFQEFVRELEVNLPAECSPNYYMEPAEYYFSQGISPKEASMNIYSDWAYEYYHNDGELL